MIVNQNGDPVVEDEMFQCWSPEATSEEVEKAIGLLLDYLHLSVIRTNATKHGNVELVLKEVQ